MGVSYRGYYVRLSIGRPGFDSPYARQLHIFEKHLGPVGVVRQVWEVRLGYPPPISTNFVRQLKVMLTLPCSKETDRLSMCEK